MDRTGPRFIQPDRAIPRAAPADPLASPGPFELDAVHSYESVGDRLSAAIDAVSQRGGRVNPSSRIAQWVGALERLASADKREVLEDIVSAIESGEALDLPYRDSFLALVESRQITEIVENLLDHLSLSDLQELVRGHPDPAEDSVSARARDKEFQWYVAALFLRGGVPVALAEPDILLDVGGEIRSVAVKRIWSREALARNVDHASRQIRRSGHPGYIVLEVTRYVNPDMHWVAHWRVADETISPRLAALATDPAVGRRRNRFVRGVFLRVAFPHVSRGFEYGTLERWIGVGIEGGNREEHLLLLHALLSGLRNV